MVHEDDISEFNSRYLPRIYELKLLILRHLSISKLTELRESQLAQDIKNGRVSGEVVILYQEFSSLVNQVWKRNLPLVRKLTRSGHEYVLSDARVGLRKAIISFDPSKGFSLSTYAKSRIDAEISDQMKKYRKWTEVNSIQDDIEWDDIEDDEEGEERELLRAVQDVLPQEEWELLAQGFGITENTSGVSKVEIQEIISKAKGLLGVEPGATFEIIS